MCVYGKKAHPKTDTISRRSSFPAPSSEKVGKESAAVVFLFSAFPFFPPDLILRVYQMAEEGEGVYSKKKSRLLAFSAALVRGKRRVLLFLGAKQEGEEIVLQIKKPILAKKLHFFGFMGWRLLLLPFE